MGRLPEKHERTAADMPAQEGGTADMSSCRGRPADLVTEGYARKLQELVNTQRAAGVQCGLAMRDHLTAEQAVDFLVVSRAAVSVQDNQATRGRISVYFKNVDRWVRRHESMWGHGQLSAASAPAAYEAPVRPMLISGSWDQEDVKACLSRLQR